MPHTMVMPKLGLTMEEGLIARWLRGEGESVRKGEPLLVIETEKITYDIDAPTEGLLHIVRQAGETVRVAHAIAVVAATREEYAQAVTGDTGSREASADRRPAPAGDTGAAAAPAPALAGDADGGRRASPLARRLAAEAGLDLAALTGTGPGGRITREDVEAAVAARAARSGTPAVAPAGPAGVKVLEVRRLSPMRRTIAARLAGSLREMAQLTVMAEVDMSQARALREKLNRGAGDGARITYTDIVVKLVPVALRAHPVLNSTLRGEELHLLGDYHIGVAVEIEDGLIVPVIRDADRKSLREISHEVAELSERARARRLRPEELEGGTFTVSNAGMLGVDAVTPIVNPPEVAILGVGRIADRALAVGGRVEARPAATLCLTFDHRVVDGAPASRFIAEVRRLLEAPEAALAGQIG